MPRRIRKEYTGGPVDYSLPPKAVEIIRGLPDADKLQERIAELVGLFRDHAAFRDARTKRSDAIRHIEQTQAAIDNLLANLALMPEDAKALLSHRYAQISGEVYEQVEERLSRELHRLRNFSGAVGHVMETWPSSKGETRKQLEHHLLADVADVLAPYFKGVEHTADMAARLLRAAGIRCIPVDKKKARAAILATRRK